ncbi:MAG: TIGR03089 family protein [Micrococcales bacterium]|nr:TIGR03089 family protein [Micrococcales bacterium]
MPQWNKRLSQALRTDPGRPRVTWYAGDGERIELSGATLDNWATKTANLLIDDADASPGTQIALEIPLHWRTVCWALGIWRTGACILTTPVTSTAASAADGDATTGTADAAVWSPTAVATLGAPTAVVTTTPVPRSAAVLQIAVALPALARAFDGALHGALDSAATLLAQPDTLGPTVPPAPTDQALNDTTTAVSYETLDLASSGAPRRVLRTADRATPVRLGDLLGLDVLADGGSLVLVTDDHPAATPGPARDHLIATERITHT